MQDILHDDIPRGNLISSTTTDTWPRPTRTFIEREGLQNLDSFLDTTIATARERGNQEVEETATALRENLVFIGNNEMQEALTGIATRLVESAREGNDVIVFTPGLRSERYMALRVLEEFDRLTQETPELRQRAHFSNFGADKVVKYCKQREGKCQIVVPDDFAVSGNRISQFAGTIYSALLKDGFPPQQAASMIEVDVIAAKKPEDSRLEYRFGSSDDSELMQIFAYFTVPQPFDKHGKKYVLGAAVTGSHASVDYGFEDPLGEFYKFLKDYKVPVEEPLLTRIHRPYESDGKPSGISSRRYENAELQKRWEALIQRYELH